MSHSNLAHRRTHNLLLISKLFGQRDQVSPFTLVLDTLEQPAKPLLREYVRRAIVSPHSSGRVCNSQSRARGRPLLLAGGSPRLGSLDGTRSRHLKNVTKCRCRVLTQDT